ncbi:MAG: hypothetical protein V4702_00185 [Patescibacteria group bacterium]
MKIKRIGSFCSTLFLSLSSLLIISVPKALAATVTWDGEGVDNSFSTAANWSGDVVPSSGDVIVFPTSVDSDATDGDDRDLNNDISVPFAGIQVTGTYPMGDYDYYTITGNALSVSGNISGNGGTDPYQSLRLEVALTATSAITIFAVSSTSSLSIGANNVTTSGAYFGGSVTGSGNLILENAPDGAGGGCPPTALPSPFAGDSSGFSGSLTIQNNGILTITKQSNDIARSASAITKESTGDLNFILDNGQDMTFAKPITLKGSEVFVSQLRTNDCVQTAVKTITISSNVTLTADTTFNLISANLKFTGTVTGKEFVKLASSSSGTITLPDNSVLTPEPKTTEYKDSSPSTAITVANNETAIVTGTYSNVFVGAGGTLKGTGTVGVVTLYGKLAPGLSPGCLNTGNLVFQNGSSYEFEVGGTTVCTEYDQTKVTGTVTLGNGTLSTLLVNNFKPVANQSYMIIENDGTDAVTGTFNGLAEGATFTVSGYVLKVSYVGGTGNDVVLTVQSVPAVPDTGFQLLTSNPIAALIASTSMAGCILLIARKYAKVTVRK